MKKKLIPRLLVFFIGIPAVLFFVAFSALNHLALHIVIIVASAVSAYETHHLLKQKFSVQALLPVVLLSTLLPTIALICVLLEQPFEAIAFGLVIAFFVFTALEIFCPVSAETDGGGKKPNAASLFSHSAEKIMSSFFTVFYSGYLTTFLSRMTVWNDSTKYLSVFFLMIFLCDSSAWLFGYLFGRGNRGVCKASQNKSVAGFAGGVCACVCVALGAYVFYPDIFGASLPKAIALALCVAFSSIVGDLGESVLKRSVNAKDSGSLIPGRGGMLDSIDSVLTAAPVFYIFSKLFFSSVM
jgi:phosphatidate cytidylyltransferase